MLHSISSSLVIPDWDLNIIPCMALTQHVLPSMSPQRASVGFRAVGEESSAVLPLPSSTFLLFPGRGVHTSFSLFILPYAGSTGLKGKGSVHSKHLLPSSEPILLSFFFLTFLPLCLSISTSTELPSRQHRHAQSSAKPGHWRNEQNTIKSRILVSKTLEGNHGGNQVFFFSLLF